MAYVFDNEFTVVFAIFMSLWGKFGTCSRLVMAARSLPLSASLKPGQSI